MYGKNTFKSSKPSFMSLYINSLRNDQVLNSFNFARKSNVVYSEVVSKSQFEILKNNNLQVIEESRDYIFYKVKEFELKENDIIFSNLFIVNDLFYELNKYDCYKNIKLITHQSDIPVNKKMFIKKPSCISEWYSINVKDKVDGLIPIPIGLSNDYSNKNLTKKYYSRLKKVNFSEKINKLYVNFEVNTNFTERYSLIKFFSQQPWAKVETKKLSLEEYVENLNKYKFVLCPPGNGIDTHRMWEVLYSNSVPVIRNYLTYKPTNELGVLKVNNFRYITEELLNNYDKEATNDEKLSTDYWFDIINKNVIEDAKKRILIQESDEKQKKAVLNYNNELKRLKRIKKFKTIQRKIIKKIY